MENILTKTLSYLKKQKLKIAIYDHGAGGLLISDIARDLDYKELLIFGLVDHNFESFNILFPHFLTNILGNQKSISAFATKTIATKIALKTQADFVIAIISDLNVTSAQEKTAYFIFILYGIAYEYKFDLKLVPDYFSNLVLLKSHIVIELNKLISSF